jgi:adenine-specific DNA-methyltransferase
MKSDHEQWRGIAHGSDTASARHTSGLDADASIVTNNVALLVRRVAALLKRTKLTPRKRLSICAGLIQNSTSEPRLCKLAEVISGLPKDYQHYWIGTFYTLLLSKEQRRRQSAYFTRPEIARHLISKLEASGTDFRSAHVLDPAAGGAAFLSMIAARMKELGCTNKSILARLRGIEIDPHLAQLSRLLIADRLGLATVPARVIAVGDALNVAQTRKFDVVVANPPYGRVPPDRFETRLWEKVCHPGHINLYALFVDLCLKRTKVGGQLGFVIPSSFIAGPLYCRLRGSIRNRSTVQLIGLVECREEFFLDVLQDVSLLVLDRKTDVSPTTHQQTRTVEFGRITANGIWVPSDSFTLPPHATDGWILPSTRGTARGGATLADYGCRVTSGYFVWNRETGRMRKRPLAKGDWVPLFWACNVRANAVCEPRAKDGIGTDFVRFDEPSQAIIVGPSILLQRTTNSKQRRRLIAGLIQPSPQLAGGYVSENHTIVVRPITAGTNLDLVCRLLNCEAVDRRYRQISGTASISTLLLRSLDLPSPDALRRAMKQSSDFEAAVETAYADAEKSKLGWAA